MQDFGKLIATGGLNPRSLIVQVEFEKVRSVCPASRDIQRSRLLAIAQFAPGEIRASCISIAPSACILPSVLRVLRIYAEPREANRRQQQTRRHDDRQHASDCHRDSPQVHIEFGGEYALQRFRGSRQHSVNRTRLKRDTRPSANAIHQHRRCAQTVLRDRVAGQSRPLMALSASSPQNGQHERSRAVDSTPGVKIGCFPRWFLSLLLWGRRGLLPTLTRLKAQSA
jgi:hypothetical protein